jgi:hypothetical protein
VDFDTTDKLVIVYSAFFKYLRKKWEYNERVYQLFMDFKKPVIQLRGRTRKYSNSVWYLHETGKVNNKNETYSGVRVGKYLSDIGGARSTYGDEGSCIQGFGGEN